MEYGIEIMLQEFDGNFGSAIAYCARQVWMAGINNNERMGEEYTRLKIALELESVARNEALLRAQKSAIEAYIGSLK